MTFHIYVQNDILCAFPNLLCIARHTAAGSTDQGRRSAQPFSYVQLLPTLLTAEALVSPDLLLDNQHASGQTKRENPFSCRYSERNFYFMTLSEFEVTVEYSTIHYQLSSKLRRVMRRQMLLDNVLFSKTAVHVCMRMSRRVRVYEYKWMYMYMYMCMFM